MTWLLSLMIVSAVFSNGNIPVGQIYQDQVSRSYNQTDETERTEQTYPFSPTGKIDVGNVNGSITIETWDQPQIKLEVEKIADSKDRLAEIKINIDAKPESFSVDVEYPNWKNKDKRSWEKNSKMEVNFKLIVPKTAILDEIHTVNGSVSISNSANITKASAVNGSVKALNLSGTADLSTVNGSVVADFDRISSGSVISLSTVNGTAKLILPSDIDATIRAESLNGHISNDFGLPVRKGEFVGRDLYGKVGNGDVKIKLESVNGGLDLKRKNDGKPSKPATNLLPNKSGDRSGDDFDNDFEAAIRESRRDLREALREIEVARRESEKAIRSTTGDAEKAALAKIIAADAMKLSIESIKPEIAKISEEAMKSAIAAINLADVKADIDAVRSQAIKAVTADQRFPWRAPYVEEKNGVLPVKGVPKISIELANCSVSIRGWDKPEVSYSMSKVATNILQKPVELYAEKSETGNVVIKISNPNETSAGIFANDSIRVRLEVFVPKKSNLKIVSNDEIRLEGVSGKIDLQGQDETINVRDSNGKLKITGEDGMFRIIGFTGELEANLQDGQMFAEGDFQKIHAQAEDGTIVITIPSGTNANIVSNSDSLNGEGVNLVREDNSDDEIKRWRIGKGGKEFKFNVADGNVTVRTTN